MRGRTFFLSGRLDQPLRLDVPGVEIAGIDAGLRVCGEGLVVPKLCSTKYFVSRTSNFLQQHLKMSQPFDVAIVGAGLAGLVAASRLGRTGRRVLLVDARPAVDRSVHTTGIFVRRTLEDFAPPEACLGPGIHRVVLHSPAGRPLTLEATRPEFRVGRMRELYRWLLEEATSRGVEYRAETRYRGMEEVAAGSRLRLRHRTRNEVVQARVVIGADGARSKVAADLGLDENRRWIVGVEEVFERSLDRGQPELHCFLDPRVAPGYIGWLSDDGEAMHLGVGGIPGRFDPAFALLEFRRQLEERPAFAGLKGLRSRERRGGRIPANGLLSRIGCRRGLLIGDAAGAVSPLTAGGLDPCYRLTRFATSMIDAVLDGAPSTLLEQYSGAPFQGHFARKRGLRRVFETIRHPMVAEAACALLRTPPGLKVAEHLFFGRGSFPDVDPSAVLPRGGAAHLFRASTSPAPAQS